MMAGCDSRRNFFRVPHRAGSVRTSMWDGVIHCIRSAILFRFLLSFFSQKLVS